MTILAADVDPADAERLQLAAVAARRPGDAVAAPPPTPTQVLPAPPPATRMKHVTARLDGAGDVVMFAAKAPELRMLIASAQVALSAITDGHVQENGQPLITDPRHDADEHRVSSFAVPCAIVEVQEFPAPAPLSAGQMDTPIEVPRPHAVEERS